MDGQDYELVQDGCECPACNEKRMDFLIWNENIDSVRCQSCGHEYDPSHLLAAAPGHECPECGENYMNKLKWHPEGMFVECTTCGNSYAMIEFDSNNHEEKEEVHHAAS